MQLHVTWAGFGVVRWDGEVHKAISYPITTSFLVEPRCCKEACQSGSQQLAAALCLACQTNSLSFVLAQAWLAPVNAIMPGTGLHIYWWVPGSHMHRATLFCCLPLVRVWLQRRGSQQAMAVLFYVQTCSRSSLEYCHG
jgi:hypothetical protein